MSIIINFLLSFFLTFSLTPPIRKFFYIRKIYDQPNFRSQHENPIVRIGGISIFISCIITFLISYFLGLIEPNIISSISVILLISSLIFLVGLIDDLVYLSPFLRLGIQFFSASLIWIFDIKINLINFFWFNNLELPNIISYLITIFWIVGITNAINWFDGLDGLLSGSIFIYLIGLGFTSFNYSHYHVLILASIFAGSCLAFLRYNSKPANIIMGDGGSNFLGFIISVLSLHAFKGFEGELNFNFSLALLSIPLLDMIFVISKRIYNKKSPFFPDRNHFHHRLLKAGLDEKKAVKLIHALVLINTLIVIIFL